MPIRSARARWGAAIIVVAGLLPAVSLGQSAGTSYEIKNCTRWDLNVRIGVSEFDRSSERVLRTEGADQGGLFTCAELSCQAYYSKDGSQCVWFDSREPGRYVVRHMHTTMANQCSYATESFGGGGANEEGGAGRYYYLRLEPGRDC